MKLYIEALDRLLPRSVSVSVQPPLLATNDQDQPVSVILPVTVDPNFAQAIKAFSERSLPGTQTIRLKRCDHISLAYGLNFNPSAFEMAQNSIPAFNLYCQSWDVVFYERTSKSPRLELQHSFRELGRWNVSQK